MIYYSKYMVRLLLLIVYNSLTPNDIKIIVCKIIIEMIFCKSSGSEKNKALYVLKKRKSFVNLCRKVFIVNWLFSFCIICSGTKVSELKINVCFTNRLIDFTPNYQLMLLLFMYLLFSAETTEFVRKISFVFH